MSYNTDLQAKNARIQALIDAANALPDAESLIFQKAEKIEYTPTSNTSKFTLNHNLKTTPDGVIIINKTGVLDTTVCSIQCEICMRGRNGWIQFDYWKADDHNNATQIFMDDGDYFSYSAYTIGFNLNISATSCMLLGGKTYIIIPFVL